MASSATSSINSSACSVESISQLNYTISETLELKNSTQISDFSKNEFPEFPTISTNCFSENSRTQQLRNSISPSETSTETVTLDSLRKTVSMKSESSQGTESSSSLTSTKPLSLDGLPALHPLQVRILKEVKKNLEITRDKVKKLELENRQIPVLKKRLDQLETELRFQNFSSPDDLSFDFSNLLSSSVPVSHLCSSPLSGTGLTPSLLLAEIFRAINCDGSGLPDGTGGDNSKSADFLPPLRKQLLKRINELKRSELQGATAHQKMLDTLSRQVVSMNAKSEELSRKLLDYRASIKMVSSAREQISQKGIEYFQEQWDSVIQNKTPAEERVKKLESLCAQLQQKVDHYKNSIMFYKTENETLVTQMQPFKTASKASTSVLEEVKSLRALVKNTQQDSSSRCIENGTLTEELRTLKGKLEKRQAEVEGEEKFLRMEEEKDIANKLAQDCQQKVSSLSSSLHQISSLMMEEKNRNDTLKKDNKEMEEEMQALKAELDDKTLLEVQVAQFKSEFRQKEREVAQLLDSLQRHEMTKDDLRRSDRELKQFKTKSQLSETRNRELTTQISDCVDKEATLQDEINSLQNQLDKQENSLQSIQALFPVPDMGTTLLDLVQDLQSELREAKELVEFLQAEKSMEEETAATANCDLEQFENLKEENVKLREDVAEMKLTREAFLSQIDTLECQIEESADRESEIGQLKQQLDVDRDQHDMRTQDLADQITDLDSLMHANDMQNAKERDELQNKLQDTEVSLARAKDTVAKQLAEIEDQVDQIQYLTRELEEKKAKAQGMIDKFFPGGMPTAQLINEANQKLEDSLTSEKEQLLKQRDEHQKLEQQVGLLDTWLQQSKQEKETLELERNQLKEANQGKLKKIIQLEAVDQHNKQLKKELREVEHEVRALRIQQETNEQKMQDLCNYKQ